MFLTPARRAWSVALNLVGIVLVAFDLVQRSLRDAPAPMAVAAWAGWSLWVVATCLPEPWVRARAVTYLGMIALGSFAGASTNVVGFVPVVVGLLVVAGTPAIPLRVAGGAVIASAALIGAGALIDPVPGGAVVSEASLLLICGLAGLSRRQYRVSEEQSRALLEERIAVEQERAEVAALTERSRIARDLHDVLAHSLGGLVIQLEAVDALLESGLAEQARDRVRAARTLAVSGLDEAKRAVIALREPDEPLSAVVAGLAAAHRAIGGQVAVRGDADRGVLSVAGRTAARRAGQELLTNARRHSPGAPTTLDLDWDDTTLTITASTAGGHLAGRVSPSGGDLAGRVSPGGGDLAGRVSPGGGDLAGRVSPGGGDPAGRVSPGGGHRAGRVLPGGGLGLAGMRERVSEAGGSMTVDEGPPFEVVLRLPGERAG